MRTKLIGVLVCFAASSALAQLPQANVLFQQGRYEEAKRMLNGSRNDPQALLLLGRIALAEGDNETAAATIEKAIEKKPNVAEYYYWLGDAYGELAQNSSIFKQAGYAMKAHKALEHSVELDPESMATRIALIDYYTLAPAIVGGSEAKAKQQAAEIARRDPVQGHRAMARIYTRQKKLDLARNEFIAAVKEQPSSARARSSLGAFYALNDKNYAAAFQQFDAATAADPAYMPTWFRIGQAAALSVSNLPRGEEALKKYLTYQPTDDEPSLASAWYYLGLMHEKQGHRTEARQDYSNALRFTPGSKFIQEAIKRVS
jgi:Tfp pilus assembly protein PilF